MPSTPHSAALLPVLPMLALVVGRIGEGASGNGVAATGGGPSPIATTTGGGAGTGYLSTEVLQSSGCPPKSVPAVPAPSSPQGDQQ